MNRIVVTLDNVLKLPWWVYLGLGALLYCALTLWLPATGMARFTGGYAAAAAPFLLAIMLVLSAAAFFTKRQLRHYAGAVDLGFIKQLSWPEFSGLIAEAFERKGFEVNESPSRTIDLVLRKDGRKILVDCKHWKESKVRRSDVEELFKVMAATQADGGYMLTAGIYEEEAEEFVRDKNMRLFDNEGLRGLLSVLDTDTTRDAKRKHESRKYSEQVTGKRDVLCPKCGRIMVRRVERRGEVIARKYYGCPAYPSCKGERPIASDPA